MRKCQAESLKPKTKIKLTGGQKAQMIGVSNLSLVDNCKGRIKQLKLAKAEIKDNFNIVELYEKADGAMIPFPETPTSNYLMPKEAEGVCCLAAITNALEAVHYKTMEDFILVLAGQRGL